MASAIDGIVRPDDELQKTTTLQKLLDIWWRLCSKSGLTPLIAAFAEGILNAPIPKFDGNGKAIGTTTLGAEIGWNPANNAKLDKKLDAALELLGKVVAAQGGSVDIEAIKQAAKDGANEGALNAIESGVVKVDVSVQGTADQPKGAPTNG